MASKKLVRRSVISLIAEEVGDGVSIRCSRNKEVTHCKCVLNAEIESYPTNSGSAEPDSDVAIS